MANVKITQLPSLSTMTDSAIIPVVASDTTQQISGENLKTYFSSVAGNIYAGNVLTSSKVIANGEIQSGTGFFTGGYLSVNGDSDLHDTTVTGNILATGSITASTFSGNALNFVYGYINQPAYGDPMQISSGTNVQIQSNENGSTWEFDNTGNLILPAGTPSINYANGAPYGGGTGSGVSIVPNDVTYTNGSLYGNADPGFTVVAGQDDDDEAYSIPVDFPIEFLGNSYSSGNVWLVSNSYLTFGPNDYTNYHPVGPVEIPVPAIFIGAMDLSNQKYYYGYADGTDVFVIGYEGSIETSGEENYPAIQWELQVNSATPDQLKIVVDGPGNNGGALNFPAGVWGVSDGAVWIDQYQPLPWYSNNNDNTYNAITIAPVVPVAVSTIAFTGPGVTYSENDGITYINIDPFDEAISVGYNDDSDEAIISSVYYGLTLTTAQDGEQLTLAPLGDVNISAGSASDNQPGDGYQVNIYGGNAHDDPNSLGQNSDGGYVNITGGSAVGNGVPGAVQVTSNNKSWTFASTGNLTLPSNTSSINYANGQPYGGSGSGATTGNVTFNDVNIIGTGNLNLQPNDQSSEYLNIYLTGAADIHVAYGGGSGNVILGTDEEANVAVLQGGNVAIQAGNVSGTKTWTFDPTGNLTLPIGGVVYETNIPDGALSGSAIALKPAGGTTTNQQLLIYPTANDGDHIHMTSGNLYATELFLGSDNFYVKLANTGNVVINSNDDVGNSAQWTFDPLGNLTLPNYTTISNKETNLIKGPALNSFGSNSYTGIFTALNYTGLDTTWVVNGPGVSNGVIQSIDAAGQTIILDRNSGGPQFQDGQNYTFTGPLVSIGTNITVNSNSWTFGAAGETIFPTLTTQRGDSPSGTITGQTLLFGDATQEAIISTPDGSNAGGINSQRLVINPGKGEDSNGGEGGDIYLWAGRGGNNNGSGGDVKIRGGQGMGNTGSGGYLRIEAGNSQDLGAPGYIDIRGGDSANTYGGYVQVTGGQGGNGQGGPVQLLGGQGATGFKGGDANIIGGPSADGVGSYGNVNISAGATIWRFDNTGNLTVPGGIVGSGASPAPYLSGFSSVEAISVSASGNVTATRVSATGNITGGNILTAGQVSATGNITTAGNFVGNGAALTNVTVSVAGNIIGTQSNVTLVAGSYNWTFNNTGNLTLPGNTFSVNYANNTPVNVVTRFESAWTVPVGNSTQSFTVSPSETYYMWVDCNIPNGILVWNATATVTNTNVPVVGYQYAWVYNGGGTPIDFTSIPNQFIGTANTIVRSNVAPSATTNRFDFGINNTSGSAQTVRYGWITIS